MCTLLLGCGIHHLPGVILAANRDEDPTRPSDPPMVLSGHPHVAGGRDRQAGGTWLAIRNREHVVAMLNRRPRRAAGDSRLGSPPARRSRGLLALGAACADEPIGFVKAATKTDLYAPFSMVVAQRRACFVLWSDYPGVPVRVEEISPGWHALTHMELDDPDEPRAAWLARELRDFEPHSIVEAERRLLALLASHGGDGAPRVCLHDGPMQTVSAAFVALDSDFGCYTHAEGRPCEQAFIDYSDLLSAGTSGTTTRTRGDSA